MPAHCSFMAHLPKIMKHVILALLSGISIAVAAQPTGIQFEHNTTWQAVLDKAKQENKYIFVDAFTTWCGPCKMMAKNIFPKPDDAYSLHKSVCKTSLRGGGLVPNAIRCRHQVARSHRCIHRGAHRGTHRHVSRMCRTFAAILRSGTGSLKGLQALTGSFDPRTRPREVL